MTLEAILVRQEFVLALTLFYWTGRAINGVLNDQPFAHRPLIRGLQITDLYHVGNFMTWGVCLWSAWSVIGLAWIWCPLALAWAVPWLVLKHMTGKLKRWDYLWPIVIYRFLVEKGWRK